MVITVLKATFTKSKPKVITYRDFKLFNEKIFLKVLGRTVPIKNKTIGAHHAPYVTKTMRKAIMKRTQLQHRYFKTRSSENLKLFKQQ